MLTKQPCHLCGTNIEFDADQISDEGITVSCPQCHGAVTLHRPPPVATPPIIEARKRHRFWLVGLVGVGVTAFVVLTILLISALNRESDYAIVPERYYYQKPIIEPLDRFAFDLGVKELNKLFYKHGEFIFVNVFREPSVHPTFRLSAIDRYVQGKRVVYTFSPDKLSEADVMNGWEYKGDVHFFITGSKRQYDPNSDEGWSEWTMFPGDTDVQNSLYGTTLSFKIHKKKGGEWEIMQRDSFNRELVRPLSRDKVEELLKLPSRN